MLQNIVETHGNIIGRTMRSKYEIAYTLIVKQILYLYFILFFPN